MLLEMNEQQLSLYYESLIDNDIDDHYIERLEDKLLYDGYDVVNMSGMLLFNLAARYLYKLINNKRINDDEFYHLYNNIADELDVSFTEELYDIINLDSINMKEYVDC